MFQNITLTSSQIIQQLKISCQIPTVFKDIYRREVIKQTAKANNIVIDEAKLQQAANDFRYSQNLLSSEATFEWLNQHGLSTDDFEELIYTNVLATTLAHHLFNDRVEPYFYANQTNYTQAVIYEIVLSDIDLAIELFYGIGEGEFSFWEVAHQYIEDVELRRFGGYRGLLTRNSLDPAVSAAVFAAKPPQLLKPIIVERKAHLILVEDLIYPKLNETLRHDIIKELFEEWLDKQFLNVRLETINFDR
jgi:parvulin-like peptidyl-prolyl isomerase